MHRTGTMDHWDLALSDGFALDREVIVFNNAGSSSGEVPTSIEQMALHAADFTDASALINSTLSHSRWAASLHSSSPSAAQTRKLILVWHWFKERRGDGVGNTRDTGDFGAKYDPPDELWLRV